MASITNFECKSGWSKARQNSADQSGAPLNSSPSRRKRRRKACRVRLSSDGTNETCFSICLFQNPHACPVTEEAPLCSWLNDSWLPPLLSPPPATMKKNEGNTHTPVSTLYINALQFQRGGASCSQLLLKCSKPLCSWCRSFSFVFPSLLHKMSKGFQLCSSKSSAL